MKIAAGDRKLLSIAIGVVAALIVTLSLLSPRDESEGSPSSYSTKKGGGKAAYLLLKQSGYNIERWESAPSELPVNPQKELLIIAGPTQYPDNDESNALRKFVSAGGTLLLAGVWSDGFAPESHTTFGKYRSKWAECKPALPSRIARGGPI
ncbi:MAG: DUF4350 domain-containing protein, partial [Bryobacteraceae bacterium]